MARPAKEKSEPILFVLPEMRLVNGHLFVKSAFKNEETGVEGTPRYRVEMSTPEDDAEFNKVIDNVCAEVIKKHGDNAFVSVVEDPFKGGLEVRGPFILGDKLAKKREAKGKNNNDGYKGMWVIRADTDFNWEGLNALGGIAVYDEEVEKITPLDAGKVYNGCYGCAKVELSFYTDNDGDPACKFYLKAFQKTRDGERFAAAQDHSADFKPVGRQQSEDGGSTRRSRRG